MEMERPGRIVQKTVISSAKIVILVLIWTSPPAIRTRVSVWMEMERPGRSVQKTVITSAKIAMLVLIWTSPPAIRTSVSVWMAMHSMEKRKKSVYSGGALNGGAGNAKWRTG